MHRFMRMIILTAVVILTVILPLAAQENDGEIYEVIAGMSSGNIEVMAFGPAHLQIHRGDTVRWLLAGFHNVHLHTEATMFLIPFEADGLQMNPEILLPGIENGGTYTGGSANSGLPMGGPATTSFELTFDIEPGLYTYFCDVHAGMAGIIEVVADEVEILSPADALKAGFAELSTMASSGFPILQQAKATAANQTSEDGAVIVIGAGSGVVTNYDFYPNVVVIKPGQSVTWTMTADITWLPIGVGSSPLISPDQIMSFVPPSEGNPPAIRFTAIGIDGSLPSGSAVGLADSWYSGMLEPGESYTLTFTEPGVYRFADSGPGKQGAVVVLP